MPPSVVFLGNPVSEHSVAFLRELRECGAEVRLVVSSERASAPQKTSLARLLYVVRHFTHDEIAMGAAALLAERAPLRLLPQVDRARRRWSLGYVAAELGCPYLRCSSVNQPAVIERVARASADLLLVHSFSEILKPALIGTARLGAYNFHAGRLPHNRGPQPLEWSVLLRETEVWTTCHALDERVDAGDVLVSVSRELRGVTSWRDVQARSHEATALALREFLSKLEQGGLTPIPQDAAAARYNPRLTAATKYAVRRLARRQYRVTP